MDIYIYRERERYIYIYIAIDIQLYLDIQEPEAARHAEQLPNQRHRNSKAFEEHLHTHVCYCFGAE